MASQQKRYGANQRISEFSGIPARKAQVNWKIVGPILVIVIIIILIIIFLGILKNAGITGGG